MLCMWTVLTAATTCSYTVSIIPGHSLECLSAFKLRVHHLHGASCIHTHAAQISNGKVSGGACV